MERIELKRPYVRVYREGAPSYGGSQMWLERGRDRAAACGLIACADVLAYLRGETKFDEADYMAYLRRLRRYFPLIPYRGMDGVTLAVGMSRCLRREQPQLRAHWCVSGSRFFSRVEEMLRADIPAVISIGPNMPAFWGRHSVPLYRRDAAGAYREDTRTHAHYVTVTGLDGEWMRISSWGREYYVSRRQYEKYMRTQSFAAVTNLLHIEQRAKQ